jgi:hypothetical protein
MLLARCQLGKISKDQMTSFHAELADAAIEFCSLTRVGEESKAPEFLNNISHATLGLCFQDSKTKCETDGPTRTDKG